MRRKSNYAFVAICVVGLLATGCNQNTSSTVSTEEENVSSTKIDLENAIAITLEDGNSKADSDNVSIDGDVITISKSGTYKLTGSLSDGQIVVAATNEDAVYLALDGVEIHNNDTSPIYVEQSKDKTEIYLMDGSVNKLSDGNDGREVLVDSDETTDENETDENETSDSETENSEAEDSETDDSDATETEDMDGVIYSKDDLVIDGTGSLSIEGNYQDGIVSKDDLKIKDGDIDVKAVDDGIRGKDSVTIKGGKITVNAGSDAIKSTNDTDEDKGYILVEEGDITIDAGKKGFEAITYVQVDEGNININSCTEGIEATLITFNGGITNITASDDGLNASDGSGNFGNMGGQGGNVPTMPDDSTFDGQSGEMQAMPDDSTFDGQDGEMPAMPDGSTFDGQSGEMPAMPDGATINEQSGEMPAMPDGATFDGQDGNMPNAMPAGENGDANNQFTPGSMDGNVNSAVGIVINGGEININAVGDGIDSNGYVEMNGGNVYVDGPVNGGNGALDYASTFTINGGLLIASGSSGMATAPTQESTQYSLMVYFDKTYSADANVQILDDNNKVVAEYSPKKDFSSIVVSNEDISKDSTYKIVVDGDEVGEITTSEITSTYGSGGSSMPGGFGGKPSGNLNRTQGAAPIGTKDNITNDIEYSTEDDADDSDGVE